MHSFEENFEEEKRLIHDGGELDTRKTFHGDMEGSKENLSFKRKVLNLDGPNPRPLPDVPVTTHDKLWDAISKVIGRDGDCEYVITGMLQHDFTTYLGLGTTTDSHIVWRLEADQEFLTITEPAPEDYRDLDAMLPESFLGVNLHTNTMIGRSEERDRRGRGSDESDESIASSSEDDGFVVLQLGWLKYYMPKSGERVTTANAGSKAWVKTNFGVVVKSEDSGRAEEVWLMFNFLIQDWLTEERFPWDESLHGPWGMLPGVEGRFSMIKIADNIGELGPGKDTHIDTKSKTTKTFELVQAVRLKKDENLVRQYITRPKEGFIKRAAT